MANNFVEAPVRYCTNHAGLAEDDAFECDRSDNSGDCDLRQCFYFEATP